MEWQIPKFPLDELCDQALTWLTTHGSTLTRAVSRVVADWIEVSTGALVSVPPWLTIAVLALVAWRLGGARIAIFTALGFAFLWNLRLWQPTMETIVLVTISTLAALTIGVPIGIACALSQRTWRTVGPGLDMMQTMPSLVYLFAMPPVIRLTALGIMQVPHELIEASDAFGSTPAQKLFKVQLPLALPTIMAGINQTIMLALSMVVIAAMIGAGGLGREVWRSIQRLEAGVGFETGIAIVIVAVILDRMTQQMAKRMRPSGAAAR
jgi:glycine betaine/proline transport system permease protein